jgi:hypothetical protein
MTAIDDILREALNTDEAKFLMESARATHSPRLAEEIERDLHRAVTDLYRLHGKGSTDERKLKDTRVILARSLAGIFVSKMGSPLDAGWAASFFIAHREMLPLAQPYAERIEELIKERIRNRPPSRSR